jgi:hypothetical protein
MIILIENNSFDWSFIIQFGQIDNIRLISITQYNVFNLVEVVRRIINTDVYLRFSETIDASSIDVLMDLH